MTDQEISPTDQELRLTSDNFLARIERLQALEEQKRELPPPETAEMAREVEALTREVLEWAERQSALAEQAAIREGNDGPPIAVVPARELHIVLDEWRAAERRLTSEQPGTAGFESARADVDRLRDEYARAYHQQSSHQASSG